MGSRAYLSSKIEAVLLCGNICINYGVTYSQAGVWEEFRGRTISADD
jgi:hypothetical protein